MNKELESFMFGNIEIKPIGKIFRCPFNCGDPRYPKPKWKTVNGIKRHLESCPNNDNVPPEYIQFDNV